MIKCQLIANMISFSIIRVIIIRIISSIIIIIVVIITWVGLPVDSLESVGRGPIDSLESIGRSVTG